MLLSPDSPLIHPPERIISLVPSQTELLFHLGLEEKVVGITKFCVHPAKWKREKTIVGGTKNIYPEKIKALAPDLIIANKEENVKEQVEALAADHPVFVTDIATLDDALEMINTIGMLTHTTLQANHIVNNIQQGFAALRPAAHIPVAYFIWRHPYMTAGGDTFINNILAKCGLTNIYSGLSRYPEVTIDDLQQKKCKLLLLSSEPYPFRQKHIDELQQHFPRLKIMLVDGEMFSWYGSRLLYAPVYLQELLQTINRLFSA